MSRSHSDASSESSAPIDADTRWPIVKPVAYRPAPSGLIRRVNLQIKKRNLKGLSNALQCQRCRRVLPKELKITPCHHLCCGPCLYKLRAADKTRGSLQHINANQTRNGRLAAVCRIRGCEQVFRYVIPVSEDIRIGWNHRLAVCEAAWGDLDAEERDKTSGVERREEADEGEESSLEDEALKEGDL